MLGFRAEAKTLRCPQRDELGDAGWYTFEQLADFQALGKFLPGATPSPSA